MICRLFFLLSFLVISGIRSQEEDETLTTPQLIQKYGYPVQVHYLTTEDGYILELHRIPYSSESPEADNKPVVFLQHGLFSSSADWIILGPGVSLGYLLADAGYDVWLGNARGNTYSKKHQTLDTSSTEYWDFSWHEMGIYDLPAVIDHVLATTGQSDILYVGHSMGTTMFYVLESEKPEYSSKVRHMISLAPIAYMEHVTNVLADIGAYFPGGQIAVGGLEMLGVGDLFESNEFTTFIMDLLCSEQSATEGMCMNVMFALIGYDPIQVNEACDNLAKIGVIIEISSSLQPVQRTVTINNVGERRVMANITQNTDFGLLSSTVNLNQQVLYVHLTMLPVILAHTPDGASTKTVLHYAQEISTVPHNFYQWNYYLTNLLHYGSLEPDTYNIKNAQTPITLMYCDNDPFGDPTDVLTLYNELPNVKELYEVALKTCNHQDFLWAKDVKVLVNDEVLRIVKDNS